MRLKCLTCGATYDTILADGMRYFHSCPLVPYVLVTRDGARLYVQPPNLLPTDLVTVQRDGKAEEIAGVAIVADEQLLFTRYGPRPGHRDENVIATGPDQGKPIAAAADRRDVVELPAILDVPFDDAVVVVP